jgi:ketosteroid isomerase-like protein
MTADLTATTAESELRETVDRWSAAVRASDVDRIMSHYAPDIVSYDAILQLQFRGTEAYRKHWQACLEMCPGEMIFVIDDPHVSASGDIGFCHSLTWCGKKESDGSEKAGWLRMTAAYRRIAGHWRIVHEHFSVPFDMDSGKALFDLKP